MRLVVPIRTLKSGTIITKPTGDKRYTVSQPNMIDTGPSGSTYAYISAGIYSMYDDEKQVHNLVTGDTMVAIDDLSVIKNMVDRAVTQGVEETVGPTS